MCLLTFRGSLTPAHAKKMKCLAPIKKAKHVGVVKHSPYHVHVYGGISLYGATNLHFATGTTGQMSKYKVQKVEKKGSLHVGVCSQEYLDIMLKGAKGGKRERGMIEEESSLFDPNKLHKMVHQHDGAKVHVAAVADLQQHCPEVMGWPPVSPDLSLIENVWSVVALLLHKGCKWRNLKEFKKAVKQAWESVTSDADFREHLFKSMPGRLQKCIQRGGEIVT